MRFEHKELNALVSGNSWTIHQSAYDPDANLTQETLFALSNGYTGVRGTVEEGANLELPGTFYAGVFDRADAPTKNLVNAPSWVGLRLSAEDDILCPMTCSLVEFSRVLDMANGLLMRRTIYRDNNNRETLLEGYRFLSIADPHIAAIVMLVRPLNWDGKLGVESTINADVSNLSKPTEPPPPPQGFGDQERVKHLIMVENSLINEANSPYVEVATRDNGTHIGTAAALRVSRADTGEQCTVRQSVTGNGAESVERLDFDVVRGTSYRVEKLVTFFTSNDIERESGMTPKRAEAASATAGSTTVKLLVSHSMERYLDTGTRFVLADHREKLKMLWQRSNISIDGDDRADRALRYNVFQLMSCYSGSDPDVSIGAKSLGGEGYRGQVFWDTEMYLLPFYIYTNPDAAKSLLLYRYNRLDAARENARRSGHEGAQFPWNSADTGEEESSKGFVTNADGNLIDWNADSMLHVVGAVAYGVEQYVRATNDNQFLIDYGAELLLETARFWTSRAEYNHVRGRYEIHDVTGPDEYHHDVDDDFYTNVLARWNIRRAIEALAEIRSLNPEAHRCLVERLGITDEETATWRDVADSIHLSVDENTGLVEQFNGYFELLDVTVEDHDDNNMPVWPKEVDIRSVGDTQLIKQADVIMAMYLLATEFDETTKKINYDYYIRRTMHKSTLSASIYAIVALSLGEETDAYDHFIRTAEADLVDSQRNTWQGPHIASAGGTWQVAVHGFTGLHVDADGVLAFDPHLPKHWKSLSFRIAWRGALLDVVVQGDQVTVTPLGIGAQPYAQDVIVRNSGQDLRLERA